MRRSEVWWLETYKISERLHEFWTFVTNRLFVQIAITVGDDNSLIIKINLQNGNDL